ncbi:MAG: hypothetical protein IJV96_02735 [Clostridia bacterium]|nr:hypothetical protein [Clostridia bacterium]
MENGKKNPPYGLVLLVLCNTVLFFGIYCYFVMRNGVGWLFWAYFAVLLGFGMTYVLYNYAFSRDKATFETLPHEWSVEEKTRYLNDRDEHKRRSRWMLTVIFPLCLTFFFDLIYLYFGDLLYSAVKAVLEAFGA